MRGRHLGRLTAALVALLLLAACDEAEPLRAVSVKLDWRHGSDFVGLYVADKKGYFAQEGLKVDIRALAGPAETDRVFENVAAGKTEFSLAGLALVRAQARGQPLVAIANIVKLSPGVLFARVDTGIRTPADLAGKRVGVKNETWRLLIGQLLAKFDLSMADVVEVPAGFDMQPFLDGEVDVWAGFIQDEPVRARMAGLEIVTLPMHEYGMRTVAKSIYTSRALLESDPDLAVGFLRASVRGWRWAVENPAAAIDLMLEMFPGMASEREFHLASFRASIPLLLQPGATLGEIDCDGWRGHELLAGLPARDDTCTTRIYDAAFAGDSQ